MAYARRVDANHAAILDALKKCGWYVKDTSAVPAFFDAVVGRAGVVHFLELKDGSKPPSKRALTEAQKELHADFLRAGISVKVLTNVQAAIEL